MLPDEGTSLVAPTSSAHPTLLDLTSRLPIVRPLLLFVLLSGVFLTAALTSTFSIFFSLSIGTATSYGVPSIP